MKKYLMFTLMYCILMSQLVASNNQSNNSALLYVACEIAVIGTFCLVEKGIEDYFFSSHTPAQNVCDTCKKQVPTDIAPIPFDRISKYTIPVVQLPSQLSARTCHVIADPQVYCRLAIPNTVLEAFMASGLHSNQDLSKRSPFNKRMPLKGSGKQFNNH